MGKISIDLGLLERLALAATADADEPPQCRGCGVHILVDPELEPSALCNPCAQDYVVQMGLAMPELVAMARRSATTGERTRRK